jgi:3-hydroxyisobutyrate dehydrogenase-like beta-hydroxyacid dehydrogenase
MGALVGNAVRRPVLWASDGRSRATAERATGFEDVGTVADLIARSEVVLSICPPAIAEDVAAEVAALGFDGLYVEANAISPARSERIARTLPRVVDGGIVAHTRTRLYLSGDPADVEQIAALFEDGEVDAVPLAGGVGAASALKLAFAGWNKIGSALVAQAHAIARAHGVEDALRAEGVDPARLPRVAAKAWRWAPEMREIADTCAALGLPDGMALGAADLFERWSAHRDDAGVDPARLLEELGAAGRHGPQHR